MEKAYRVVRSSNEADLVVTVNELAEQGYEPLGGLLVSNAPSGVVFYQSLYRKAEKVTESKEAQPAKKSKKETVKA